MSAHYSKYSLNTYCSTPYFQSQVPEDYPTNLVLQACRAFRNIPPNLKELAALSKQWARRKNPPDGIVGIDDWYSEGGRELNPDTGKKLSRREIEDSWEGYDAPKDFKVTDVPEPEGGFDDPDIWEEPAPEEAGPDELPPREQLLSDIASRGREATADAYGIPVDQLPV